MLPYPTCLLAPPEKTVDPSEEKSVQSTGASWLIWAFGTAVTWLLYGRCSSHTRTYPGQRRVHITQRSARSMREKAMVILVLTNSRLLMGDSWNSDMILIFKKGGTLTKIGPICKFHPAPGTRVRPSMIRRAQEGRALEAIDSPTRDHYRVFDKHQLTLYTASNS